MGCLHRNITQCTSRHHTIDSFKASLLSAAANRTIAIPSMVSRTLFTRQCIPRG
jgi:hypothetical protein